MNHSALAVDMLGRSLGHMAISFPDRKLLPLATILEIRTIVIAVRTGIYRPRRGKYGEASQIKGTIAGAFINHRA